MAKWHVNDPGNIGPECYSGSSSSSNSESLSSSSSSQSPQKQGIILNLVGLLNNCHGGACEVEIDSIGRPVGVVYKANLTVQQPAGTAGSPPAPNIPPLIGHYEWRVNDPNHLNPEDGLPIDQNKLCVIMPMVVILDIRCGPEAPVTSSSSSLSSSSLSSSSLSSSSSSQSCSYDTQGMLFTVVAIDRDQCAAGAYNLEIDSIAKVARLVKPECSQVTKRIVTDIFCEENSSSSAASVPKIEYTTVIFPAGYMFCEPVWREVGCCWYVQEQWIYPIPGTAYCTAVTQAFDCGDEASELGVWPIVGCPEGTAPL